MLLQVTLRILLIAVVVINVQSKIPIYQPNFCAECEEEVWEEVPCDAIYPPTTTSSPVTTTLQTTTPIPSTVTLPPSTAPPTTTSPITTTPAPIPYNKYYPIPPTVSPITYGTAQNSTEYPIESSAAYKGCYCECKSGCREYCRKVVLNPDTSKQILQLSRVIEPSVNGYLETKHSHERHFVPTAVQYPPGNVNPYYPTQQQLLPNPGYAEQKPVYNVQPIPIPIPIYNSPQIAGNYKNSYAGNSIGYSQEEFTKLLNSYNEYSNSIPKISQSNYLLPNQQALPNLPQSAIYPLPPLPPQPPYPTSVNTDNSAQTYSNSIPLPPQSSYPLSPPYPSSDYPSQPSYAPSSVDAQTAIIGGGSAAAVAISPSNYKASISPSSNQDYTIPSPIITSEDPNPKPIVSLYPLNYKNPSLPLSDLQNYDPAIENYLRDVLYLNPSRTRGYQYPL